MPQGAEVTRLTFYYYDAISANGKTTLFRSELGTGVKSEMADNSTHTESGTGVTFTSMIENATIDKLHYIYWVEWDLPVSSDDPEQMRGTGVKIDYLPPETKTGVLSLPAAAFTAVEDGYDYQNSGYFLRHYHSPGGGTNDGYYHASVDLPQGAVVTKFTFYWFDSSSEDGTALLRRTQLGTGNMETMATANTSNTPGAYSSVDDDIENGDIDNALYAYWVVWRLPIAEMLNPIEGVGIVIEYTLPTESSGVLSIPAAAFMPSDDGVDFQNDGGHLRHNSGGMKSEGWYYAQLHLPHGVTVTNMTFYWYDVSDLKDGSASLVRNSFYGGNQTLATVGTSHKGGYGDTPTSDIVSDIFEITNDVYQIELILPAVEDVKGCGVVIEYDYRLYLPVLRR